MSSNYRLSLKFHLRRQEVQCNHSQTLLFNFNQNCSDCKHPKKQVFNAFSCASGQSLVSKPTNEVEANCEWRRRRNRTGRFSIALCSCAQQHIKPRSQQHDVTRTFHLTRKWWHHWQWFRRGRCRCSWAKYRCSLSEKWSNQGWTCVKKAIILSWEET